MKARLTYDPFWDTETADNRLPDDSINIAIHNADIGVLGAIEFYNRMTYTLVPAESHTIRDQFGARFKAGTPPVILPLGPIARVA